MNQSKDGSIISWIEKNIKHYEFIHFNNIQQIGSGHFSKVYKAKYRNMKQCFALKKLKSFENDQDIAYKEIVKEVNYSNINSFFFIKKKSLV